MNTVGSWLQIFANIGILVGLVFVGLQMRQEQQLASIQLQADTWNSGIEMTLAAVGENVARSYARMAMEPENLTAEDVAILSFWFRSFFLTLERLALLEEQGLIDDSWQEEYLPGIAAELGGNPITREWVLEMDLDEPWVESLQEIAAKVDETLIQEVISKRLKQVQRMREPRIEEGQQ